MQKRKQPVRLPSSPPYGALEPRQLLSADIYQPGFDSVLGVTVNSFVQQDPRNPLDSYDVETGWLAAVDELASLGIEQVNFAVYRVVDASGHVNGGTEIATVNTAVNRAKNLGLEVSVLPLFETASGWRGNYNPSGNEQSNFQSSYRSFLLELTSIKGIDRLTVASELNAMVLDQNNNAFFDGLIDSVSQSNFAGEIGFTANFDVYDTPALNRIWSNPKIDFIGVSAYNAVISPENYELVSGTGAASNELLSRMIEAWNRELDGLIQVGQRHGIDIYLQEVGAVKENYSSIYPWAVNPGDFVSQNAANRYADDPGEQAAVFRSLMLALDGRGSEIKGADFWSWDHQADRGGRSVNLLGGIENRFSVWPTDNAGGSELVRFVATNQSLVAVDDFFSQNSSAELDIIANDVSTTSANIVNVQSTDSGRIELADDNTLLWNPDFLADDFAGSDSATDDKFGFSVAIDGNLAVVGAPFHDSKFRINNGAVYVYQFVNERWLERTKIVSPTDRSGDLFGWSVDIDNGRIVVGSMHDDMFATNSGAAYLFERGANNGIWNLRQSLDGSDVRIGDRFGVSVAIDDDLIAVGQRFGDGVSMNSGSVSIFKPNDAGSWTETDRINSGSSEIQQFGWDLDLHRSQLAVGAPRGLTGSAWLYSINSAGKGSQPTQLTANDIGRSDRFGTSIAISQQGVFVGSPFHDADGTMNTGAVYEFDFAGNQIAKLTPKGSVRGDQFGFDVSANEGGFVTSALGTDISNLNSGATYIFTADSNTWRQERLDVENGFRSGYSVAFANGKIFSGMVDERGDNPRRGRVFSFVEQATSDQDVQLQYTIANAAAALAGNEDASFGSSISTFGQWAVVGAPTAESATGVNGGAAVVFQRIANEWRYHSRLAPSTLNDGDHFGAAVKMYGSTIVVGAHLSDEPGAVDVGAAYVFERSGSQWQLRTKLLPEFVDANDQFGFSIDVDQNRIAVGALYDDHGLPWNSGTVSVHEKQNDRWSRTAVLRPNDAEQGSQFGYAVSLHGDGLAATAPLHDRTGKAYVFRKSYTWTEEATLTGTDRDIGDQFGHSVNLSDHGLFVGALKHDHNQITNTGAVFHFAQNNNSWAMTKKLTSNNAFDQVLANDQFGSSIDVRDGILIVGSNLDDSAGKDSGSVFLFEIESEYELKARIAGSERSEIGKSLSVFGDQLMIGGAFTDSSILVQDLSLSTATVTLRAN